MLLPACALDEAMVVVERLRSSTPGTSCSVGLAEWVPGEPELDLLHRADQRLYEAKREGGGRIVGQPGPQAEPALASS